MKKNIYIYSLLIILPFLILLPYTLQYLEVGNDFELYYFTYKKYIFELLKSGHLPLWSPVEASGASLIFNPLTQYFYLPSWLFYFVCFLFGEITKYYFLIYTIFAISIFNVGFFLYFKTLDIDYKIILTTIFITCLSLKITELIRFPNALHSFAWFPWILYGINLAASQLKSKKSFFIIFFSCLMLFTAGYPYYIFYAFVLSLFYFIFLSLAPVKQTIFTNLHNTTVSNKFFFIRCAIPSIFAALVASPWILKISQLVSITYGRNNPDIDFSLSLSSNIYDQIGSWLYPPYSFAEGWFYFGSISVLIIITTVTYNFLFNKDNNQIKYFSYLLIFLLFFSYQISNPAESIIFKILWNNFDFIQSFRNWARFNIIFVPIITIVLAYCINDFINLFDASRTEVNLKNKKIIFILISFFILILSIQSYFIFVSDYKNNFWEVWQLKRISFVEANLSSFFSTIIGLYKDFIYPIFFTISLILLILVIKVDFLSLKVKKNKNIFLNLILIITFSELFFLTNIQWAIPFGYYDNGFKDLNLQKNYNKPNHNALLDLKNAFKNSSVSIEKTGSFRHEGNTYYRNNKRFNINHINNWGNENHVILFKKYFDLKGNLIDNNNKQTVTNVRLFFGLDDNAKRIFYSKKLEYKNISEYINASNIDEVKENFLFNIIQYNGDLLVFRVEASHEGWVSFIDTWDHNWQVFINGEKKEIKKLFGAYKTVKINPGVSTIKFIYKPFNINLVFPNN